MSLRNSLLGGQPRILHHALPIIKSGHARMRINGRKVSTLLKSPIGIAAITICLFLITTALFSRGGTKSERERIRDEVVAGYDLPDSLQPVWRYKTRHVPRSSSGGPLGINNIRMNKFELPDSLAEELMDTCEERGGEMVSRSAVKQFNSRLADHAPPGSEVCFRKEGNSGDASLLHDTTLVVLVHWY